MPKECTQNEANWTIEECDCPFHETIPVPCACGCDLDLAQLDNPQRVHLNNRHYSRACADNEMIEALVISDIMLARAYKAFRIAPEELIVRTGLAANFAEGQVWGSVSRNCPPIDVVGMLLRTLRGIAGMEEQASEEEK